MNSMVIGSYVSYKQCAYLVVGACEARGSVKILHPHTQAKLFVKLENVTPINCKPMKLVEYQSKQYLVSAMETIVSMDSLRVMQWESNNGNRVAILKLLSTC